MTATRRLILLSCTGAAGVALLPGCAGLAGRPGLRVDLAGLDSLPGEGLELRFMLKLRVQNPGDAELRYDGVWAEIDLRGQPLASGVAPVSGLVPRFGEVVVALPVTASGLSLAHQALGWIRSARGVAGMGPVSYALRGRLGGTGLGGGSFETRGEIDLGRA